MHINGTLTQFKFVGTFRFNGFRTVATKDEKGKMYHMYFKIPQLNERQCQSYSESVLDKIKGKTELEKITNLLKKCSSTSAPIRETLNLNQ